jgi:hypothetical protein
MIPNLTCWVFLYYTYSTYANLCTATFSGNLRLFKSSSQGKIPYHIKNEIYFMLFGRKWLQKWASLASYEFSRLISLKRTLLSFPFFMLNLCRNKQYFWNNFCLLKETNFKSRTSSDSEYFWIKLPSSLAFSCNAPFGIKFLTKTYHRT